MTAVGAGSHVTDFDPSEISEGIYASRVRRGVIDVATLLNLMTCLLFLLPARLVVPQLTNFGRPALIIGLVLVATWSITRVHRRLVVGGNQPMRWIAMFFLVSLLLSYVAGSIRGMSPLESNGADRALIQSMIFLGVILAAADGIPTRARLDDVVRVLVWCGGFMALLGGLEWVLKLDLTEYIRIPGLQSINDLGGLEARTGFYRVASTANHYIEFSVVMAMLVPFAIHLVRFGATRKQRQLAGACALLMTAAIPIALSRSGIIALMVALVVVVPFWPHRAKLNIAVIGFGLLGTFAVARPSFLGTLVGLFANMGGDDSISGRTDDYASVYEYFSEAPYFGRGYGTFIPKLYIILDNQWLLQLVTGGLVGLLALIMLHLTGMSLAVNAYRRSPTDEGKHLAVCLFAVQMIAMLAAGTFDSFSFTTFSTTFALLTGVTAALWRLTHPSREIRLTVHSGRTV